MQLRAKGHSKLEIAKYAEAILPLTKAAGVPLIINDYPDCCGKSMPKDATLVRRISVSPKLAIWLVAFVSSVGQLIRSSRRAAAQREKADYIGFGPLFPTGTKPSAKAVGLSEIRTLHEQVQLPIFVIGGVKLDNLGEILRAGAKRVCMVSDLLLATDMAKRTAEVKLALSE